MYPSRLHQGESSSTVPLLDITPLPCIFLLLFLFVTLLPHALRLHLSVWIPSSLLFLTLLPRLSPWSKSSPIYCIFHVSVFPLFFFSSLAKSHKLWVFFPTKAVLSLFICACLFPLHLALVSLGFSQTSRPPLISILSVVSHFTFLKRRNLCSSPSLRNFFLFIFFSKKLCI